MASMKTSFVFAHASGMSSKSSPAKRARERADLITF
jgi:hypothetical protein